MNFGKAIESLKDGKRVCRNGWNGKGMFIILHKFIEVNEKVNEEGYKYEPCIIMFTADEKWRPGWLASQSDMLSEDWEVI